MDQIIHGFAAVFQFHVLLFLLIGVIIGTIFGALPGLTAAMGVAVFLPLTFAMAPLTGLLFLVGIYFGGVYGGSITAILLRTPGTPASAATIIDGHPMAQRGEAGRALMISTTSSAVGGIVGVIVLILLAPKLAKVALEFGSPETFALAAFGISIIASVSGKSVLKGMISGCLGLVLAVVGLDPVTAFPRFTFGNTNLLQGFSLIPVLIGLFAAVEAFRLVEDESKETPQASVTFRDLFKGSRELLGLWVTFIRSALIGTFIGIIPGAGAGIASFVGYDQAKRWTRKKSDIKFGEGRPEGVAASEAASCGVEGGAFVPMLTLGIPGDAVTAIMLGALMIMGLKPGPALFTEHADLVHSLFSGMLIANVFVFIVGILAIRFTVKILTIPKPVLITIILSLCTVGSYAINNSYFDVLVMLAVALVAFVIMKFEFPAPPIILALILGPMAESQLRRSLVLSNGSLKIFLDHPIALALLILAAVSIFLPVVRSIIKTLRSA
ncbi:MAG TPA: tripartite tricarboxylate transporter permease [Bacillales bacterium]|nr:tripartite tricarboxylate transporter permease [Bacillales bacterium]